MVKTFVIILVIVIILGLLGIWYKILYSKLQNKKIKIDEAENIINDHLQKRYDYVIRTSHLIKKNLDLDIELFKEIEVLKAKKTANNELDEKISDAYNTIIQLKEDYPELNENRGFKDIIADFEESNEIIEASKTYFDKYAEELNNLLSKFPTNLIGKLHGFKKEVYYNTLKINNNILNNEIF